MMMMVAACFPHVRSGSDRIPPFNSSPLSFFSREEEDDGDEECAASYNILLFAGTPAR